MKDKEDNIQNIEYSNKYKHDFILFIIKMRRILQNSIKSGFRPIQRGFTMLTPRNKFILPATQFKRTLFTDNIVLDMIILDNIFSKSDNSSSYGSGPLFSVPKPSHLNNFATRNLTKIENGMEISSE